MKKREQTLINCLLINVCFFVSCTVASADVTKPTLPEHSFKLGLEARFFDYEEDGLMEENGFMYGFVGSYVFHSANKLMVNSDIRFIFGELKYDGQTWAGIPVTANTDDWIVECRGLIGYDHIINAQHRVTPFMGIAYRNWNDIIGDTGGYERSIQYWYSPIGIETSRPLSDEWTWGLTAEYDLFWGGKVKSNLSDVDPGYNDPEVDQGFANGYGLRFSLLLERELMRKDTLSIELFIRYWDIDESDTAVLYYNGTPINYVYEPENETVSYGLSLGQKF